MKKYKNKSRLGVAASALLLVGALSNCANVFAADNYVLDYSGGEPLGASNVTIDPERIESFTRLFHWVTDDIKFSNSNRWQDGYTLDSGTCKAFKYFKVSNTETVDSNSNLSATFYSGKYKITADFEGVQFDHFVEDGKSFAVGIAKQQSWVFGMSQVFADPECTTEVAGIKSSGPSQQTKMFVKTKLKLYDATTNEIVANDKMYFELADIDAAQSYKVLNSGSQLVKQNMFAKSAEDLQDPNSESRNMLVSNNGNYIYSEYANGAFNSPGTSNIFLKLDRATQENGLDIVFGFAATAASGIEYYSVQYEVNYQSDDNGTITGITDEEVLSGYHPSGTSSSIADGYVFKHWVADKNVTLQDGTEIEAGQPISAEQITQVVVDDDITFTAIHAEAPAPEDTIATPDTGTFTGTLNAATLASVSIMTVLGVGLFIRLLPRFAHKKVKFNK